ncbi:folylpolyglutamate synthetase, putative, partial [Bodo saltans]
MEVGIGGRIDTTNVIPSSVCGITSLGMDHMELLGDTIEEIALEKAGIMKCGVPCFAGPQLEHPVTRSALQRFSADVECPLMFVDACAIPPSWLPWPVLSIGGVHVVANSQIALMLARTVTHIPLSLPLTEDEIRALSSTTFAGRSQVISLGTTTIFLDGAHTPESIAAASTWFSAEMRARLPSKNVLLFYSTRDGATLFHAMQQAFQGEEVSLEKCIITAIRSPKLPSQNDE